MIGEKRRNEKDRHNNSSWESVNWDFLELSQLLSELFPNKAASYKTQSSGDKKDY